MSYIFFDECQEVTQEVWDKINTLTDKERFLASLPHPAGLPSWVYQHPVKRVRKARSRKPLTRWQQIKLYRRMRRKWAWIGPLTQKWQIELLEHYESVLKRYESMLHRPVQNRPR